LGGPAVAPARTLPASNPVGQGHDSNARQGVARFHGQGVRGMALLS